MAGSRLDPLAKHGACVRAAVTDRNAYMRERYQDPVLRARHQEIRRASDARRYGPALCARQVARARERRHALRAELAVLEREFVEIYWSL